MLTNIIGWSCTVVLIISYLFKEKWLRIINSIASILFIIYGILLGQMPIIVNNIICLIIHIVSLVKMYKKQKE